MTIIKSFNLFKTSRTTPKNLLTPEIQMNKNKKRDIKQDEFDDLVHSTDQAKYSDRKLRIEPGGNEIPEEVLNPGFSSACFDRLRK